MRFRVALLAVVVGCTATLPALAKGQATSFTGHWQGSIKLPTAELAFMVDLRDSSGALAGRISIPAQNANNLPLSNLAARGDSITFVMQGVPGSPTFRGARAAGNTVEGQFAQGGQSFPFTMRAGESPAAAARKALAGFDRWVDSALAAWQVVGASVGIIVDGEVVYAKGHGLRDLEKKLPVTTQTIFPIGSSSKAFTTFALGALVDQGKLDWDAPVANHLPGFGMYDPAATAQLSARDLVTHRSGLPRHDLVWYNNNASSRDEIVSRLPYLQPNKGLRETFQYNNLMYLTAGVLAGKLNGTTWEDAVRTLVFQPLGMSSSNFSVVESQRTSDYSLPYRVRRDTIQVIPFRDISMVGPAGSINSNMDDMLKWVGMLLDGGKANGKQIIQPATLRDMYTPHMAIRSVPNDKEIGASAYGLGWFTTSYRGHFHVHHGGNIDGFSALVNFFPQDKIGIIVLTNQNGSALTTLVTRHAADRLFGAPFRDWSGEALARSKAANAQAREAEQQRETARITGTRPSHPLADYVGDYAHPGYGTLSVTLDSGRLVTTYNAIRTGLQHWHYDVFDGLRNPNDPTFEGMKYSFTANLKGDIDAVAAAFEPNVDPIVFQRQPDARLRDPQFLRTFVGRYALATDTTVVALKGDVLTIATGNGPATELVPYRRTEFNLKGLQGFSVVFTLDAKGSVTGAQLRQPRGVLTAKRVP